MAFPGQMPGGGNPMDPISAACCGRSRPDGTPEYQPRYPQEYYQIEKRPPDSGRSPRGTVHYDHTSREEIEDWVQAKFQELSKGLEASLTSKYLASFSNFEGRLGMLEHTQRLTAHERKSQQPPVIQSIDSVKDEQTELLVSKVAVIENRIKEMQAPIAILQDRAEQSAIPEDRPEDRVQKEGGLQDEQVVATIGKRIEMGETTMARMEDVIRGCSKEITELQSTVERLEKIRADPNLPSFGANAIGFDVDRLAKTFMPSPQGGARSHFPSPEPTREGTEMLREGTSVSTAYKKEMDVGTSTMNGIKDQMRELKAFIVTELEREKDQIRKLNVQIRGPSVDGKVNGPVVEEGLDGAGVQVNIAEEEPDPEAAEASKIKGVVSDQEGDTLQTSPGKNTEVDLTEGALESYADQGYALENNIWDASIFIGHQCIGRDDSVALGFLLVLNVLVQALFCFLATMVFTDPSFGEMQIAGFKLWRTDISGRWDYREQISGMSLGRRVCEDDSHFWGLELSTTQAQAVQMLREYLGSDESPLPTGLTMCILALFCWFVSLTSELRLAIQCLSSVAQFPLGRSMKVRKNPSTGRITISAMNHRRFIFVGVVCMLRMGIVCLLAYVGTKYVVYTETVGDLLLNAVALHFVLDVDELLFGLVPAPAKGLIADLMPLPAPRCFRRGPFKLRYHQAVSVAGLLTMICWSIPSIVKPDMDNRQLALDALCLGNKDFVYGLDRMGVLNWARTKSDATSDTMMRKVLRSIIKEDGETSPTSSVIDGAALSLKALLEQSSSHAAGRHNSLCVDVEEIRNRPPSVMKLYEGILEDALPGGGAGCTGAEQNCNVNSPSGTRLRQLCPKSCGCQRADSWNALANPRSGCPSSCSALANYSSSRNCTELEPAQLRQDDSWKSFTSHLNKTLQTFPMTTLEPRAQRAVKEIPKFMLQEGCNVVSRGKSLALLGVVVDFCSAEGLMSFFKSIRIWCPVTCKCAREFPECPRDCPSWLVA